MLDTRLSGRKPEREPTRDVGMQEEWGEGGGRWGGVGGGRRVSQGISIFITPK